MSFDPKAFADSLVGKWVDKDGFPPEHPWQCHDIWLAELHELGGKPGDGHAPGNGDTVNVFYQFGKHRPGLTKLFRKVNGAAGIQAGDVLFWKRGAWYPGSHTAMATGPVHGELVPTLTQNPGAAKRANLITRDLVGYLRPIELDDQEEIVKQEDIEKIAQRTAQIIATRKVKRTGVDKDGKPRTGFATLDGMLGSWEHQTGLSRRIMESTNAIVKKIAKKLGA